MFKASEAVEKSGSQLALVSGQSRDGGIAVALATPQGSWAQLVTTKREYGHRAHRNVIATVMLDMLRRYLDGRTVIGQYEFLTCERQIVMPAGQASK